jgi:hypothetical protein
MKALIRVTLALAAVAVCPLFAAAPAKDPTAAASAHAVAAAVVRERLAKMMMLPRPQSAQADAGASAAAVTSTGSGPRVANPFRSYPPSCLADPLPDTPSGPTTNFQMALYTRDSNGVAQTPETVNVFVWRVACSSSGNQTPYNIDGLENAAVLLRIERSGSVDGNTNVFPTFPSLTATQASQTNLVRGATEPNTVIDDGPFDSPIIVSTTYVLENYPYQNSGYTYFNNDFNFIIDPVFDTQGTGAATVQFAGYQPDQNSYPAAFQNLPIDGYMSSAWYDTAHSGEGLMVQIYDNADNATRTLFAAWYTYDDAGIPFWLSIQGVAAYGSNTFSNVPVYYYTGGGFAGNFSSVTQHVWGTMNFTFPDCTRMNFDFTGAASDVAGGPAGTGSRTFRRLADINALYCE